MRQGRLCAVPPCFVAWLSLTRIDASPTSFGSELTGDTLPLPYRFPPARLSVISERNLFPVIAYIGVIIDRCGRPCQGNLCAFPDLGIYFRHRSTSAKEISATLPSGFTNSKSKTSMYGEKFRRRPLSRARLSFVMHGFWPLNPVSFRTLTKALPDTTHILLLTLIL